LPIDVRHATRKDWISTIGTNLAILAAILGLGAFIGIETVLKTHAPIVLLTAILGIWLFYVQHQFEQTTWDKAQSWDLHEAALHGSSHYDLPGPLRWISGNIGVHHVHHLSSRIPFYRLPEVLRDYPQLRETSRIGLRKSFACARLHLWDEDTLKLISFREEKQGRA
jgi:acyl-lipid omega-6 desaturase (Delta-12 desaturase)